eukprot:CAMPEP_0171983108 /NCGR_PEP_ID=MMETSP0993-20121228/273117_1 /TAXON_ID=483369 /ORGANISM="non described non described, Strain CCMP2098" /LENGTH=1144 /DNA_ID=CAMNT_0012635835 /DNA_START=31 /DNA_END=3461 /DNA_ORIENTATION=-
MSAEKLPRVIEETNESGVDSSEEGASLGEKKDLDVEVDLDEEETSDDADVESSALGSSLDGSLEAPSDAGAVGDIEMQAQEEVGPQEEGRAEGKLTNKTGVVSGKHGMGLNKEVNVDEEDMECTELGKSLDGSPEVPSGGGAGGDIELQAQRKAGPVVAEKLMDHGKVMSLAKLEEVKGKIKHGDTVRVVDLDGNRCRQLDKDYDSADKVQKVVGLLKAAYGGGVAITELSLMEGSGVEDDLPDLEANQEAPRSLSDAKTRRGCGAIFVKIYQVTSMLVKPIDIVLVLVLSLSTLWALYAPEDTHAEAEACVPHPSVFHYSDDSSVVTTVVTTAIAQYCDCVPERLAGDLYFDPVVAIIAAFAIVLAVSFVLRFHKIGFKAISSCGGWCLSAEKGAVVFGLKLFNDLPQITKRVLQNQVTEKLSSVTPAMPDVGMPDKNPAMLTGTIVKKPDEVLAGAVAAYLGKSIETVTHAYFGTSERTKHAKDMLLQPMDGESDVKEHEDNLAKATAALAAYMGEPAESVSEAFFGTLERKKQVRSILTQATSSGDSSMTECEENLASAVAVFLDKTKEDVFEAYFLNSRKKPIKTLLQEPMSLRNTEPESEGVGLLEPNKVLKSGGKGTPGQDSILSNNESPDRNDSEFDELYKHASSKWVMWYFGLDIKEQETFQKVFMGSLKKNAAETREASEHEDAVVFFFANIILALWVLLDYFSQSWPRGDSWLCRPSFFVGIMMYKPFTLPLWSCLTLCCHYTFVEVLYKDYGRAEGTGSAWNSPLIRSRVTVTMVSIVAALQALWVIGALPITLPLVLIFFPVVFVLAIVVPSVFFTFEQVGLGNIAESIQYGTKEDTIGRVTFDGYNLRKAWWWLRDDREVVLKAVGKNGRAIRYASKRLKNDVDVVEAAIGQDKDALEFAGNEVLSVVLIAAAKNDAVALKHASESIKKNEAAAMVAVKKYPLVLGVVSRNLPHINWREGGDKTLVLEAVKQNGNALQYAASDLKADKEIVLAAVQQNGNALQYAANDLKADKEIVLAAVQQNRNALKFAADKEIVLAAVQQDGKLLEHAAENFKNDKMVVLVAAHQHGGALKFVSKELIQSSPQLKTVLDEWNNSTDYHLKNQRRFWESQVLPKFESDPDPDVQKALRLT